MSPPRVLDGLDDYQRRQPIVGFCLAVAKRFGETGAGSSAAAVAYYGFFSLFPLLLVLASVSSLVLRSNPEWQHRLLDSALAQFPVIGTQIRGSVGSIEGSGLAAGLGIVLALWAGIGGIRAAQSALDTVDDVPRASRRRTLASIAMSLVMLSALGVFVLGGALLAGISVRSGPAAAVLGVAGSAAVSVLLFAVAYRVLVSEDRPWRSVVPGAILAGLAWTLLLVFGSRLVSSRVASASEMYGTFAIVIGLLGWIYLGTQLMLLGAVVNVVLAQSLWPRSLRGVRLPADERSLRRSAMQERRDPEEQVIVRFYSSVVPNKEGDIVDEPTKRSTGTLVSRVLDGLKTLGRREFELAKIEASDAARERTVGVGLMAGAGVMALFALGFVATGGMLALALVIPSWTAALIVGGVFIVVGGVLVLTGRAAMRRPASVEQTRQTLEEDIRWAKQQIKR